MFQYYIDSQNIRYELYQSNPGPYFNWLFIPGGPGIDSSYLHSLIGELELPGQVWLVDLPGNGSHMNDSMDLDSEHWLDIFPEIFKKFENPILVGHSFGGMFPLLFPELEHSLKGLVILNSTPSLWLTEAAEYAKQFDIPDLTSAMETFTASPSDETFKEALNASLPYYFPKESLEKGKALLQPIPSRYEPAVWWQRKAIELNFTAQWIPQEVPTLIVGAKYDCICPFTLFKKDRRFQRANIELGFIENGGHFPWVENPEVVKNYFEKFIQRLE